MRRALGLLAASSCLPLTLSHEASLDFTRYTSVRVVVTGDSDDSFPLHLREELRGSSGFASATTEDGEDVDVVLSVNLVITQSYQESAGEVSYDCEGTFEARDEGGALLTHGSVSDDADTYLESGQDCLDEVGAHFIPSYRY